MTSSSRCLAVALSGGVDSSLAAALCVESGMRVFAIMLRLWSDPGSDAENACCPADAVDAARSVADRLGIELHVIDAREVFKREVVDAYLSSVVAGSTPNPCLICNERVRFGYLLDKAGTLGAEAIATGHYARLERAPDGAWRLLRGIDRSKDQSYVLSVLGQQHLERAVFPLGALTKSAVRLAAAERGLPTAGRADSSDLCWVGRDGASGFLSRSLAPGASPPGPILAVDGTIVGRHRGLAHYTVGQRRGLGLCARRPTYVLRKELATNALVVGDVSELYQTRVEALSWHWIAGRPPHAGPWRVTAQTRYRSQPAGAWLRQLAGGAVAAEFDEGQRAVTPGQALVAYDGDVCLGVGLIAGPSRG